MSESTDTAGRHDRGGVRHDLTVVGVHVRVTALNELQYRANFFLQLLQSSFHVVNALVVVALVFSKTPELNGWTRAELLAAVGVFTIIGGIMRSIVQPPLGQLMDDVQEGAFDFVLTRPADAQLLMSVRAINVWQLVDVVIGAVIVVVALPDLPSGLGAADVAMFVVLLAVGAVIAYCMLLALSCFVFWVVRLPAMENLFHYITRAAQYPISIYPGWLRVGLTVVVPLGIAVTAPAEAVTSRLSWQTAAVATAVMVGTVAISRVAWKRGVRRYSGASA